MPTNEKISQSELSRRINVPEPKLRNAIKTGLVTPDEIILGRMRLFHVSRIQEIAAIFKPVATTT